MNATPFRCGVCGATSETALFRPRYRTWFEGQGEGRRKLSRIVGWGCVTCGAEGYEDETTGRVVWPNKAET